LSLLLAAQRYSGALLVDSARVPLRPPLTLPLVVIVTPVETDP
jgi:hypothetical protein